MRPIKPAKLDPSAMAIASSTAQNSGSRAMEVAWPESWTERFLKDPMAGLSAVSDTRSNAFRGS
jgi:hypothetical protein